MAAAGTGTHETLAVAALSGVRTVDEEPDHRDGSLGTAAALLIEALARDRLGDVDDRTRSAARDGIADAIDDALRQAKADAPAARASLPWAVAFALAAVLVMGAFGVTFAWVSNIDRRTTEAEAYDRAMAQWLIISHENNHEALTGLDEMVRAMATAQGVEVGHVAKPQASEPPTQVSMKALEAIAK